MGKAIVHEPARALWRRVEPLLAIHGAWGLGLAAGRIALAMFTALTIGATFVREQPFAWRAAFAFAGGLIMFAVCGHLWRQYKRWRERGSELPVSLDVPRVFRGQARFEDVEGVEPGDWVVILKDSFVTNRSRSAKVSLSFHLLYHLDPLTGTPVRNPVRPDRVDLEPGRSAPLELAFWVHPADEVEQARAALEAGHATLLIQDHVSGKRRYVEIPIAWDAN